MKTSIIQSGNSYGVTIPGKLAKEYDVELKKEVDVQESIWHKILKTLRRKD
jgi:antitoxin component of MazEF toxin-antitoxin module